MRKSSDKMTDTNMEEEFKQKQQNEKFYRDVFVSRSGGWNSRRFVRTKKRFV